jgi:hypothetical protein
MSIGSFRVILTQFQVELRIRIPFCDKSKLAMTSRSKEMMPADIFDGSAGKLPRLSQVLAVSPVSTPNPTPIAPGRDAAIRASHGYFVQMVKLLSEVADGDIIKGILFVSIIHANTEILRRMDASSHAFATTGDVAPDEMRQPVSVYALAKGLGMPYETTRRYVARLIDEGLCVKVGGKGGIIVPGSVLASPRMVGVSTRHYAQIMKFVGMVNHFSSE